MTQPATPKDEVTTQLPTWCCLSRLKDMLSSETEPLELPSSAYWSLPLRPCPSSPLSSSAPDPLKLPSTGLLAIFTVPATG